MRIASETASAVVAAFVAEAAALGDRPPIRLVDHGTRGWKVASRRGDALVLDEYGSLWWVRLTRTGDGFVVRASWPEEERALRSDIETTLRSV